MAVVFCQPGIGMARLRQAHFSVRSDIGIECRIVCGDALQIQLGQFDTGNFFGLQRATKLAQTEMQRGLIRHGRD